MLKKWAGIAGGFLTLRIFKDPRRGAEKNEVNGRTFLIGGVLAIAAANARAEAVLDQSACLLNFVEIGKAERGIPEIFGDLPEKSPRLARIVKSGMLIRKGIEEGSAFDRIRKKIAALTDLTDEEIIREMNRTGRNPTNLSDGNAELMILGTARRRGDRIEVTITHIRRSQLNWSENSGPNTVVTQLFAAVLEGIEANLKLARTSGNPVKNVTIRAGAVANLTLEEMFLSFGFIYDPLDLAKLTARQNHPILRHTDRFSRWFERKVFRTKPETNVGKRVDLILEFKPKAD